jgi:hypothetical protein
VVIFVVKNNFTSKVGFLSRPSIDPGRHYSA